MTANSITGPAGAVTVAAVPADLMPAWVDRAAALHRQVYREAPYNIAPEASERFRALLLQHSTLAGFGFTAATTGAGDLVALAYGYRFAGTWWPRATGPGPAALAGQDVFAIMEWIVAPPHRSGGVGQRVFDALLADRLERAATLAVYPEVPARRVYRRWGWQVAGTTGTMDLLTRALPAR